MKSKLNKIKRIAKDVYKTLGSGFSEGVYDKAMQVGLQLAGIKHESQKVVELKYKDLYVGEGYPDIIVHLGKDKIVIEMKAVQGEVGLPEEQQLRNYMKLLKIRHGLLINFQQPGKKEGKTKIEIREVKL
jgi:GxxExxY protein